MAVRPALSFMLPLLVASAALSPPAAAVEADAVAETLRTAMAARGDAEVTYDTVSSDGADIVISGFKSVEIGHNDRVLSLPVIRISGVTARVGGGFIADRITFDGGSISDAGRKITWSSAAMRDVTIPTPAEVGDAADLRPFGSLAMREVELIRTGGKLVSSVETLAVTVGAIAGGQPSEVNVNAGGIWISADMMRGARRRAMLAALGYTEFRLDVSLESTFDFATDTWNMRSLVARVDEIGDFSLDAELSGIALGELAVSARRGAAREAASLDRLRMRFDNRGLVERALDTQASMMGVERSAFVEQFIGAVPFMLNFIGNPPFQAKLAVVIADFLRQPLSLTVETDPELPVAFQDILSTLATNRSALPDLLSVSVSAND